jgi:hypothetical protein
VVYIDISHLSSQYQVENETVAKTSIANPLLVPLIKPQNKNRLTQNHIRALATR